MSHPRLFTSILSLVTTVAPMYPHEFNIPLPVVPPTDHVCEEPRMRQCPSNLYLPLTPVSAAGPSTSVQKGCRNLLNLD
eukprot:scaffold16074_cov114-Isochrysis_galbana.AAC.1